VPVDMTTGTVTAVPVVASGAEAIRVAREFAALDGSGLLGITVPHAYGGGDLPAAVLAEVVRVIGNYLLNGVLPPNHGQI
jgi:alkylation response protein AidB-like acyl-CoA dehydrogenase